jgi:transposase
MLILSGMLGPLFKFILILLKVVIFVSNKLFAGIDVSLKDNQLCLMDGDGNTVGKSLSFANNLPGTLAMVEHLNTIMTDGDFEKLTIGMEATALYWFPLFNFLNSKALFGEAQSQVLSLNPKIVSNFRNSYPDMDKTDDMDSFVIADRLRFGRIPQGQVPDVDFLALQRLTRFRYHLVQCASELKNYAKSFLFLTFSEWSRNRVFSDLFGATPSKLLKKFCSAQELAEISKDELKKLLNEFSKGHFRDVDAKAETVKQSAVDSFPIPKELADQVHLVLKQTLQQLELLEKHVARLDKKIAKQMKKFNNVLESARGIGPVLAAGILAEIGDISRFPGQAQLAKYAGLTWRKNQSGNFTGDVTPLTKTGNSYLRYYLIQAAQCMITHNAEYKEYYNRKFKETTRHAHKRALTLTARKLVRLIFAMLSNNQLYLTPDKRMQRNKEVDNLTSKPAPVDNTSSHKMTLVDNVNNVDNLEPTQHQMSKKEHKKVKGTAAARSSSRQIGRTQRTQDPKEQYAVNT